MKLDLNCDLGEGESPKLTRALMKWVSSVNIACGGHAGSAESMARCVRWAKQLQVRVGAHPGAWNPSSKGREPAETSPAELELLLLHQVGALERVCRRVNVQLHHIKLHGALYHLTESEDILGKAYVEAAKRWWPKTILFLRAGSGLARCARAAGLSVWEEVFADRGYKPNGRLVPRNEPGALLTDDRSVRERIKELLESRQIAALDGSTFVLRPQTICVHSDSPGVLATARTVARLLRAASSANMRPQPRL